MLSIKRNARIWSILLRRSLAQVQTKDSQHDLPQEATQISADIPSIASVRVSVIIPAWNEEEMIGRCLNSLAASCYPEDAFEVVLVDNGSTDRTLEVAQSFSTQLQLTIKQAPGLNISGLRNLGAAAAKGEVLAFLDADCSVPTNWIENAVLHLASEYTGVIGGNYEIPEDSSWVARVWFKVGYAPKDGEVTYVPSGNMLMRKSTFLRIGGFNESIKTSEDCELCFRARRAGFTVREITEMVVVHWGTPQTLLEFYRREVWHGEHVAKVFFQNIRSMTNFRAVAFAAYILTCGLIAVIGWFLALFYREYTLLGLAVCAMLLCPFLCSLRKLRFLHGKMFWLNLAPLTLLYLTWGIARARSLMVLRILHPRSSKL
jgi:glycosyltransferase involved in cell wall biosynthesis